MKKYSIFVFIISLIGCKEPLDKNFETIKENYKIGYHGNSYENIFVKHNKDLGMMGVIIPKRIKRIGFDNRFAIVERVGNYDDYQVTTLDTAIVRYYIVDMTRSSNMEDKEYLFGPATFDEFLKRKKELGIAELNFSKEFKVN